EMLVAKPERGPCDLETGIPARRRAPEREHRGQVAELLHLPQQRSGPFDRGDPHLATGRQPAQELDYLYLGTAEVKGASELGDSHGALTLPSPACGRGEPAMRSAAAAKPKRR